MSYITTIRVYIELRAEPQLIATLEQSSMYTLTTIICKVLNIYLYFHNLLCKVGWIKADTKAIQAIHEHVITHNPRVTVSHSDLNTWNLHIKSVTEDDRGGYMCQLNTDPMKSQVRAKSINKHRVIFLITSKMTYTISQTHIHTPGNICVTDCVLSVQMD